VEVRSRHKISQCSALSCAKLGPFGNPGLPISSLEALKLHLSCTLIWSQHVYAPQDADEDEKEADVADGEAAAGVADGGGAAAP
jgi:hypothetical protein